MSEMTSGRRFSWRAMTSMMTTGGFLIMGATGLMLFATPEGRLAYWVDWSLGGLTKEEWGAIHVTSSLLFLIAGFVHLWFNWRQFVAYLRHRLERKLSIRPEAPAATALLAVLVAGTLWGVPPFTWVLDLSAAVKASWSVDASLEPPFGHAEEASLDTMALRTATPVGAIVGAIRAAGYTVESTADTLRRVADRNGVSPAEIWVEVVRRVPSAAPAPIDANAAWTPDLVDQRFEGAGFGAKSIDAVAKELALPTDEVVARLEAAGIAATPGDRLKAVAETAEATPTELLKVILVPGFKLPE
ncbi:hypothetical protein ANOBCDAF_03921 [Pleomorphomonas sp. T1.2MG-36]|uniref:DUF4405 domain-containing protein n=1 Tax=Pleomorphomonas sp. T1.2MG-36 TaxID=3041167 RepID=UPI002477B74D|nr:DUF4405 domain-containing protein [Pleomorphomonas sp. T1.2MG-36]CAI9417221.1 hypothetical protein ANOBCDAF_03921 [Pleomorphomonas sp. T1.2MG-36]